MRGTMLIYRPHEHQPTVVKFERPAELKDLKDAIDGGYLEAVPGFGSIGYQGVVLDCVAMCDEDGKRKQLPVNNAATLLWDTALRRRGPGLLGANGLPIDWLVGPVIVLFGDAEFTATL